MSVDALFIGKILNGDYDDNLDYISELVRQRHRMLRDQAIDTFRRGVKVGEIVRFTDEISPKYLRGLLATVEKVNQKTVLVRINEPDLARRYGSGPVRCPMSLIERLDADA